MKSTEKIKLAFKIQRAFIPSLMLLLALSTGCAAGRYATTGAVGGGLTGGAIGALAGIPSDRSLEGAAIGALAGSVIGNVTGDFADRDNYAYQNQQAAYLQAARGRALNLQQLVEMSRSGVGDQLIINQMQANGVLTEMTANDIIALKQNGVSDSVILAWQNQGPIGRPQPRTARVQPVIVRPVLQPAYGPHCYNDHFGGPTYCPGDWH